MSDSLLSSSLRLRYWPGLEVAVKVFKGKKLHEPFGTKSHTDLENDIISGERRGSRKLQSTLRNWLTRLAVRNDASLDWRSVEKSQLTSLVRMMYVSSRDCLAMFSASGLVGIVAKNACFSKWTVDLIVFRNSREKTHHKKIIPLIHHVFLQPKMFFISTGNWLKMRKVRYCFYRTLWYVQSWRFSESG